MLLQRFQQHIQQNFSYLKTPNIKLLLAVSGGVDSVVLTDLISNSGIDFIIAHCNFQLRNEESTRDENFVASLAKLYNKEFLLNKFNTEKYAADNKITIQEAARNLRYNWFSALIEEGKTTYLLTAHHADDNIETVVMNFFRGTGVQGLCGIHPKQSNILRPLLAFKKEELITYANEKHLKFIEDSSNSSDKYTRNFIRNKVLPLIKEKYNNADDNILHNIQRLNDVNHVYQSAINNIIKGLLVKEKNEWKISVLKLKKTQPLKTIIWEVFKQFDVKAAQADEIIKLLDAVNSSYFSNEKYIFLKDRKWIIITAKKQQLLANHILITSLSDVAYACGSLIFKRINAGGANIETSANTATLNAAEIELPLLLRPWKQGDYFYPLGMEKKKKLSRFFIDQKLSAADKSNVWVIEMNKKILWVINHRIDNRFKVTGTTKEVLVIHYKH